MRWRIGWWLSVIVSYRASHYEECIASCLPAPWPGALIRRCGVASFCPKLHSIHRIAYRTEKCTVSSVPCAVCSVRYWFVQENYGNFYHTQGAVVFKIELHFCRDGEHSTQWNVIRVNTIPFGRPVKGKNNQGWLGWVCGPCQNLAANLMGCWQAPKSFSLRSIHCPFYNMIVEYFLNDTFCMKWHFIPN